MGNSAKMLLVLMAMVGASLSGCEGSPPSPTANPIPTHVAVHPLDADWDSRAIFREGLIKAEQAVLERLPGATVYHIDLQVPADFSRLQGRQEVHYTNREDEPLDEVYFRLYPNLTGGAATISAVEVDGHPVEPTYEFQNSAARVPLPKALQPGDDVVIEMEFTVEVPQGTGRDHGMFGYFDGVLMLDEFYPVIPVYDDEGWSVGFPARHGDLTHLDASFYLVRVTAPADLLGVASGVEVGRECEGDSQVLTFAAGPARDFYLAASDGYTVLSEAVGETAVNSYALAGQEDGAKSALEHAVGALKVYNDRFGVYPYTELDILAAPMPALGMEYPGAIVIAGKLYDPNEQIRGVPSQIMQEGTVAHEVAHQWFYNTVGNDQVSEPWLDEAVVQYAVSLYYVDEEGDRAAQDYRDSWYGRWDRVDRADIPIGMPATAYDSKEYGAIVYGRGPIFMAALAEKLGPEASKAFLRDYYETNKWETVSGDAFKQLAERHCQCNLTPLFEEWVYEK